MENNTSPSADLTGGLPVPSGPPVHQSSSQASPPSSRPAAVHRVGRLRKALIGAATAAALAATGGVVATTASHSASASSSPASGSLVSPAGAGSSQATTAGS
jgi:hypothetical protein